MDISKVKEHFKKNKAVYVGIAFGVTTTLVAVGCAKHLKDLRIGPTYNAEVYHNNSEKLCRLVIERSANWGKPIPVADIVYDTDTFKAMAESMLEAVANAGKEALV